MALSQTTTSYNDRSKHMGPDCRVLPPQFLSPSYIELSLIPKIMKFGLDPLLDFHE